MLRAQTALRAQAELSAQAETTEPTELHGPTSPRAHGPTGPQAHGPTAHGPTGAQAHGPRPTGSGAQSGKKILPGILARMIRMIILIILPVGQACKKHEEYIQN